MTALAVAIERRQWTLVSLRLLVAVGEAASRLPPGSLEALLDLLAAPEPEAPEKKR
jgi:hypothetical protein